MPFSGLMWILPKKASVNLSKQNIWSNAIRCNNIPLSSTGIDTKHVYQFNVRFYQNPLKGLHVQYLSSSQKSNAPVCNTPMSPIWKNGKTLTFMLRSGLTHWMFFFISWNAAHEKNPWSDAYNSACSESHGNSGFLTQCCPLTNTTEYKQVRNQQLQIFPL